jgi:hypothetical protein
MAVRATAFIEGKLQAIPELIWSGGQPRVENLGSVFTAEIIAARHLRPGERG